MENALAAQYLRVSTERQDYSLECQRAGIETYARRHNFTVCRTYVDAAKSGLEIKHRQGLSQLLQDVVGSYCPYKSILVYDVSRWSDSRIRTRPLTTNFCAKRQELKFIIAPSISATTCISRTSF